MRLLRYAWAFPASLVGLVFGAFCMACGARWRVIDGTLEIDGGGVARGVMRLPPGMRFGAITFGHVILGLDESTLHACRCHEQVHVRQYERWGVLFFPLYLGSSLVQLARGRDPYRDNCFEREAYRRAP
ncbi:MAG TPA: hypothetical protein VM122_00645 [Usitatibacter sp.]|nr:hypothetical protein [Usitatibacter sp.]